MSEVNWDALSDESASTVLLEMNEDLCNKLRYKEVTDILFHRDILTEQEKEAIENKDAPYDARKCLTDLIRGRGIPSLKEFLSGLHETQQDILYDQLLEAITSCTASGPEDEQKPPKMNAKDLISYGGEDPIGVGSYAKVYRKTWQGNIVAMKAINDTKCWNATEKKSLCEGKLLWSLKHENIVKLYGVILCKGSDVSFAMEYADGGTLANAIRDCYKKMTFEVRVNWATQLASGLNYLHIKDYVHRDLHARNVLLDKPIASTNDLHNVKLKIADFGEASDNFVKTKQTARRSDARPYQAPEVWGVFEIFSKKSDVWSYGVIVHFILMNKTPTFKDRVFEMPELLDDQNFRSILKWCLQETHERRPDMYKVLHALEIMKDNPETSVESYLDSTNAITPQQGCYIGMAMYDVLWKDISAEQASKVLQSCHWKLVQHLTWKPVADYLYSKKSINHFELETIKDINDPREARGKLLGFVRTRSAQGLQFFLQALMETSQSDLYNVVISMLKDVAMTDCPSGAASS